MAINNFGVFLEKLQRAGLTEGGRTRSATPAAAPAGGGDATERIMLALRDQPVIDPTALGLNFVELGRAVERLLSLQAVTTADENGRQVIRRGEKFDDVCFLLKLE